MSNTLPGTVYKWLQLLNLPVAKEYVESNLRQHISFPSLLSITDLLDTLQLSNSALVVDKDKLNELPVPLLAHIGKNGGDFILITNKNKSKKKTRAQLAAWSGIVLVADPQEFSNNEENKNLYIKQLKFKRIITALSVVVFMLVVITLLSAFTWYATAMCGTAFTGLFLSILMVRKQAGLQNGKLDELCDWAAVNGCDTALKKKKTGLMQWLPLADMALIWFATLTLTLPVTALGGLSAGLPQLLTIASTASIPLILYALWYQKKILKTWCTVCILIAITLFAQSLIGLTKLQVPIRITAELLTVIQIMALISMAITLTWVILRRQFRSVKQNSDALYQLKRFKNDPDIFFHQLNQQRKVNTTLFENELVVGNPLATVQIIMACNPYCSPCAATHNVLHDLTGSGTIGLTIRFAINTDNKENPRTKAAAYLLSLSNLLTPEKRREALHHWYQWMDMEKFSTVYTSAIPDASWEILNQHQQWSIESEITGTPSLFINGQKLPATYSVEEMVHILNNTTAVEEYFKYKIAKTV